MKEMNCLQYCINGMSDRIFSFAKTKEGKALLDAYKKLIVIRENQIKELLIAYKLLHGGCGHPTQGLAPAPTGCD